MATKDPARSAIERAVHLERSMARVRWFGVLLGVYQVVSYRLDADPYFGPRVTPGYVKPGSYAVLAGFVAVNILVAATLRRGRSLRALRALGLVAFGADCFLLFGLTWLYTFDRNSTTFVLMYILGLEGALRFQLRGALIPVAIAFPLEVIRDLYRHATFHYPYSFSSATYRVGIMAIIAAVAGIMARNLERERAREHGLAESERAARIESEAFHRVVLAGLEGGGVSDTCARIVETMAEIFRYDVFAIAIVEETAEGAGLRCVGAHGYPADVIGRRVPLEGSIGGHVATTGQPMIIPDTATEPLYNEWLVGIRSELCVPIVAGGMTTGVVNVESCTPERFGREDLDLLSRLAAQIGLVITQAHLLTQERETVQRLRELDQMKSDFVAITSHELRTPLTSIRGFVKTLRRPETRPSEGESEQYLAIIDRQTDRLTRLVEDLLVASRIEAGTMHLNASAVEPARVVDDVLETLGERTERLHVAIAPDVPAVVTDGERLGQVVANLVENALKFSPAGAPVTLNVRWDPGVLVIDVADRGEGIPQAEVERIFDRFYQVGGSLRRRAQGAGLGLYISRWIVDALGGTISAASVPGAGSTFTVRLPLRVAAESEQRTG